LNDEIEKKINFKKGLKETNSNKKNKNQIGKIKIKMIGHLF